MERKFDITCDAISSLPVEFFSIENQRSRLVVSSSLNLTDFVRDVSSEVKYWLPIAAECLGISPDLKDYILTPVISMPSDLPNRNKHAFPTEELLKWAPDLGVVAYKSWKGQPCFIEHSSEDHTIARGIILDCILKTMPKTDGNILKVIKLAAWDRKRDPILANDILNNGKRSYSMGAKAGDLSCSICGSRLSLNDCGHVGKENKFLKYGRRIAYWNAHNIKGQELSHVASPAYTSASESPVFSWM